MPLDDVGRRAIMNGAQQAMQDGGEEGLQRFVRQNLGEHADEMLHRMGIGHHIDPSQVFIPAQKANQVTRRGWSLQSIQELSENPAFIRSTRQNPHIVNRANGNPVTYFYRSDGYCVVVDDVTQQIVQVADTFDPSWIDEMTNVAIEPIIFKP